VGAVLVTGGSGFVGTHLLAFCHAAGDDVSDLSLEAGDESTPARRFRGDLRDPEVALAAVRAARPERVYHLAARASVAASWRSPRAAINDNVVSTLNLLEALRTDAPGARVLVVGTGAMYSRAERAPVTEDAPVAPQSPYAAGKAACDVLAAYYGDVHDMHVLRIRAFNHAGPGQSDEYVVSALARQIAEAERDGVSTLVLRTGDLRPRRDFTDVRDVVRAYRMALESAPPAAYNVCTGRGVTIAEIVAGLGEQTTVCLEPTIDPSLLRENETFENWGANDRLTNMIHWEPEISLASTLSDTLDWWRRRNAPHRETGRCSGGR
jgi:GDP-4-dehydro-6-deoxy-D-mannose reductase